MLDQIKPYARRKRVKNATLLTTPIPVNGEWYPYIPSDPALQTIVVRTNNTFHYYPRAEYGQIAEEQNIDLRIVGYAAIIDGRLQQYINDRNRPDALAAFEEFQRWIDAGLHALSQPPPTTTEAEAPASTPTVIVTPSLVRWLRVVTVAFLIGQIVQIGITLAR